MARNFPLLLSLSVPECRRQPCVQPSKSMHPGGVCFHLPHNDSIFASDAKGVHSSFACFCKHHVQSLTTIYTVREMIRCRHSCLWLSVHHSIWLETFNCCSHCQFQTADGSLVCSPYEQSIQVGRVSTCHSSIPFSSDVQGIHSSFA